MLSVGRPLPRSPPPKRRLMEALGLHRLDLSPQNCYTRRFRDLEAAGRFGAEYFMPCKRRVLDALAKLPHQNVAARAARIRDMWDPTQASRGEVVRNFDVTDALQPFLDDTKEPQTAEEVGSVKKRFQTGDVVVSRLRSYLQEIAVVRTSGKPQSVGSSEFIVLRPTDKGLTAETLMVYLRSPLVQTILKWSQDGSNHPRFTEDDLLAIPVPDRVLGVQKQMGAALLRRGVFALFMGLFARGCVSPVLISGGQQPSQHVPASFRRPAEPRNGTEYRRSVPLGRAPFWTFARRSGTVPWAGGQTCDGSDDRIPGT